MIDVYGELIFQTFDTGPFEVRAFDDENRVVIFVETFDVADLISRVDDDKW